MLNAVSKDSGAIWVNVAWWMGTHFARTHTHTQGPTFNHWMTLDTDAEKANIWGAGKTLPVRLDNIVVDV